MVIFRSLLLVLEVLASILLIGLILLQKSKGGGLGTAFGGGGDNSMFGSRTGNVLTKATIILGLIFLVNTLILGMLFTGSRLTTSESAIERELMNTPAAKSETQPAESASEPVSQAIPQVQEQTQAAETVPATTPENAEVPKS